MQKYGKRQGELKTHTTQKDRETYRYSGRYSDTTLVLGVGPRDTQGYTETCIDIHRHIKRHSEIETRKDRERHTHIARGTPILHLYEALAQERHSDMQRHKSIYRDIASDTAT